MFTDSTIIIHIIIERWYICVLGVSMYLFLRFWYLIVDSVIFVFLILFTQYCLICSFPCGHSPIFVSSKVWSIVCWSVLVKNIAELLLTWRKTAINQSKYVCAPYSCSTIISNKINIRFSCHLRFLNITHFVFGYQYVEFELSITTICHTSQYIRHVPFYIVNSNSNLI
jgi:hypothetical protein